MEGLLFVLFYMEKSEIERKSDKIDNAFFGIAHSYNYYFSQTAKRCERDLRGKSHLALWW